MFGMHLLHQITNLGITLNKSGSVTFLVVTTHGGQIGKFLVRGRPRAHRRHSSSGVFSGGNISEEELRIKLLRSLWDIYFVYSSKPRRKNNYIRHRRIFHLTQDVWSQHFNLDLGNSDDTAFERDQRHLEYIDTIVLSSIEYRELPSP